MRQRVAVLATALVCLAGAAAAQTVARHLEVEADLAEKETAALAARYEEARAREEAARARVDEAAGELDARLAQAATPLDQLQALERRLTEARAAEEAAETEARDLRGRLLDLRRRQEILAAELRRTRGAPADLPDPITGAWNLALEPGERRGLLDLTLDVTTVSGTLGLDDGSFGSVRGTFAAGALRLERVSAEGGLDMVLEGRLRENGSLQGTWRPLVLGRGEPPGGTWTARKATPEEEGDEGGAP